jgi:hypothetical protein
MPLLESPLPSEARDLTVAFNGGEAPTPTAPHPTDLRGAPGDVLVEHADVATGQVRAVVAAHRSATVVLSASFDPGWTATVNGREEPTAMVAPALVGVVVGPGVHDVTFSYRGFDSYPALFLLALVVLAALAALSALRGVPAVRRRVHMRARATVSGRADSGEE